MRVFIVATAVVIGHITADSWADPTIRLRVVGAAGPFVPNDIVTISVAMADLAGQPAAGLQAFLEFDPVRLQFEKGHYTAVPFGLPVISPIEAVGGAIDLASGVNVFSGQAPTAADSTLALLQFKILQHTCRVVEMDFRAHDPPSRLTDGVGNDILPLTLSALPDGVTCPADVVPSGVVQVNDLLLVINNWGPCPPMSLCCADITNDGVVNVNDLLNVINNWGPCP